MAVSFATQSVVFAEHYATHEMSKLSVLGFNPTRQMADVIEYHVRMGF